MRRPSSTAAAVALAPLGAGILVAAALPPWGWWPLALVGLGIWEWLLVGKRSAVRARRTALFSFGWFLPGLAWMWYVSIPGFALVLLLFAGFHALAAAAIPDGPDDRWRWLALPSAFTAAEALRFCFPFGGVPLASLPLGQAGGPFVGIARIGGPVLLTFVTALIGTNLRRALLPLVTRSCPTPTRLGLRLGPLALIPAVIAIGSVAPDGSATGRTASIVIMQGGGPQGTRAATTPPRFALDRALEVSRTYSGTADLVVWPENVINVRQLSSSKELQEVGAEAARIGAPFLVGITERDDNPGRFRNAQIAVLPDASVVSRYEKKRRVPFGEYMPMRSFLRALGVPTQLVPRDAVPGTDPAVLDTPSGTVGVAISWEVFFGGRVREAVHNGAGFIINPTNGSSYRGAILQSQQIAASRLRAIESGRWMVQVAPTGFSAFVSPTGEVFDRIGQTVGAWRQRDVEVRSGLTVYQRTGDKLWVLLVLLLWSLPLFDRLLRRYRTAIAAAGAAGGAEAVTSPPTT